MDTVQVIRLAARLLHERPYEDNPKLDDMLREAAVILRTLGEINKMQKKRIQVYAEARQEAGLPDMVTACACCANLFLPEYIQEERFHYQCPHCVLECRLVEGAWRQGKFCPSIARLST